MFIFFLNLLWQLFEIVHYFSQIVLYSNFSPFLFYLCFVLNIVEIGCWPFFGFCQQFNIFLVIFLHLAYIRLRFKAHLVEVLFYNSLFILGILYSLYELKVDPFRQCTFKWSKYIIFVAYERIKSVSFGSLRYYKLALFDHNIVEGLKCFKKMFEFALHI